MTYTVVISLRLNTYVAPHNTSYACRCCVSLTMIQQKYEFPDFNKIDFKDSVVMVAMVTNTY